MKVFCRISGFELYSSHHFKNEPTLVDLHPIFRVPVRNLLAKSKRYGQGNYSTEEKKLLFLALLHATEVVEWEVPASPSPQIVDTNLEAAFKFLDWYSIVSGESFAIKLPKYRVTPANSDMRNIEVYFSTVYELRKEWMAPSRNKILSDLLARREDVLYKIIHSPHAKKTDKYISTLASWAMGAAGVKGPDKIREWTELFKLKPDKDLFSCDLQELQDLQAWMQRELYAPGALGGGSGSEYSAAVLNHLHELVELRKGGMLALLGGEVGGPQGTYKIKDADLENETSEDVLEQEAELVNELTTNFPDAPISKPKKEDFGGMNVKWIKANAAWVLSAPIRERLDYVRERLNGLRIAERGL